MITVFKIWFYKNARTQALKDNDATTAIIVRFCNIKIIRLIKKFYE